MMVLAYDYQGDCQQQHGEDTFWHPKWVWFKSTTVYRGVCWWWWWRRWWGGGGCFEGSDNKFNTCWEGQCTLFDARRRPDPVAALHFAPLADFVAVWHWTRPRGNRMPPPREDFLLNPKTWLRVTVEGPQWLTLPFVIKTVSLYHCIAATQTGGVKGNGEVDQISACSRKNSLPMIQIIFLQICWNAGQHGQPWGKWHSDWGGSVQSPLEFCRQGSETAGEGTEATLVHEG